MGAILSYFRLRRGVSSDAEGGGRLLDAAQYLALLAGIFVQPFLAKYRETGTWNLTGWGGWLIFAAIVGVIVFPSVYRNAFDPTKPIYVQLCAIFAAGLGWQTLFQAAVKIANLPASS